MANRRHLAILKHGVEEWNRWRKHLPRRTNIDLSEADLMKADFYGFDFHGVDLCQANLQRADLRRANLHGARLIRANLRGADLRETYFRGANVSRAAFHGARFGGTSLASTWGLASAEGLASVEHAYDSAIDTITLHIAAAPISRLDESQSQLTELTLFFRACGMPKHYIESFKDTVGKPSSDLYSCFISYSSADSVFAKRLYDDLQDGGVRCWRDRENLKIGERIRQSIFEAIRGHQKSIVILSANSIERPWVRREVETVLRLEDELNKEIIFPIRLDDSVFATTQAWAAELRERYLGDFSGWTNPDTYKKALKRLLGDLAEK